MCSPCVCAAKVDRPAEKTSVAADYIIRLSTLVPRNGTSAPFTSASETSDHALRFLRVFRIRWRCRWRRRCRGCRRRWRWHLNRRLRWWHSAIVERLIQRSGPVADAATVERAHSHAIHTRLTVPLSAMCWRRNLQTREHTKVVHDFDLVRARTSHFGELDVESRRERSSQHLRRIRWTGDPTRIDRWKQRAWTIRTRCVCRHGRTRQRRRTRRERRRARTPNDKHACENEQYEGGLHSAPFSMADEASESASSMSKR